MWYNPPKVKQFYLRAVSKCLDMPLPIYTIYYYIPTMDRYDKK